MDRAAAFKPERCFLLNKLKYAAQIRQNSSDLDSVFI
jgi:hypothetical protein